MRLTVSDPRLADILETGNFYLTHGGEILNNLENICENDFVQVHFKLRGGKGGFGSLLRAIGSQIHRTTDRQSCRFFELFSDFFLTFKKDFSLFYFF